MTNITIAMTYDKYTSTHRQKPSYDQCSVGIQLKTCAEPEIFEKHLREHTNFEGKITSIDKVYMGYCRLSLIYISVTTRKKYWL